MSTGHFCCSEGCSHYDRPRDARRSGSPARRDHRQGRRRAGGAGRTGLRVGESGAGKTSFVEAFVDRWVKDERVLWGACDPLPTPRPLGPIHDVAHRLAPATQTVLAESDAPYDIFDAVYDDLRTAPSVLVLDDLQWADQGTIDLLRFVLRRVSQTRSLAVGIVRDDEVGVGHPLRVLFGDAARSTRACSLPLPPLSVDAVERLVGEGAVDPVWLHRVTGGNAFFVCEMLEHQHASDTDLPTTVRDAVLARTSDLDPAAWDALNLLTCSPGAVPDRLLTDLGVTLPALRALSDAGLTRRSCTRRGVPPRSVPDGRQQRHPAGRRSGSAPATAGRVRGDVGRRSGGADASRARCGRYRANQAGRLRRGPPDSLHIARAERMMRQHRGIDARRRLVGVQQSPVQAGLGARR